MSAEGMTLTVLATELAEAVAHDETPENGGCDLSAGMYGPDVSAWLRKLAAKLEEDRQLIATRNQQLAQEFHERTILENKLELLQARALRQALKDECEGFSLSEEHALGLVKQLTPRHTLPLLVGTQPSKPK